MAQGIDKLSFSEQRLALCTVETTRLQQQLSEANDKLAEVTKKVAELEKQHPPPTADAAPPPKK